MEYEKESCYNTNNQCTKNDSLIKGVEDKVFDKTKTNIKNLSLKELYTKFQWKNHEKLIKKGIYKKVIEAGAEF